MSDRCIHVFDTVAKHLSYTKAAQVLFMTQPAVPFRYGSLKKNSMLVYSTERAGGLV
jgi:DNA-binding transcriptional LysR family regulator